jgi:hypothetical protein
MDKTTINSLFVRLEKMCCKLQDIFTAITNQNIQSKYDWETACLSNDGGITIVNGLIVYDMTLNTPLLKYYIDGLEVFGYSQVSCGKIVKYDYEDIIVCVDGKNWTKTKVYDKLDDGTPNLIQVLWFDENDTVVTAPDITLINNANCDNCISTPQGVLLNWG